MTKAGLIAGLLLMIIALAATGCWNNKAEPTISSQSDVLALANKTMEQMLGSAYFSEHFDYVHTETLKTAEGNGHQVFYLFNYPDAPGFRPVEMSLGLITGSNGTVGLNTQDIITRPLHFAIPWKSADESGCSNLQVVLPGMNVISNVMAEWGYNYEIDFQTGSVLLTLIGRSDNNQSAIMCVYDAVSGSLLNATIPEEYMPSEIQADAGQARIMVEKELMRSLGNEYFTEHYKYTRINAENWSGFVPGYTVSYDFHFNPGLDITQEMSLYAGSIGEGHRTIFNKQNMLTAPARDDLINITNVIYKCFGGMQAQGYNVSHAGYYFDNDKRRLLLSISINWGSEPGGGGYGSCRIDAVNESVVDRSLVGIVG